MENTVCLAEKPSQAKAFSEAFERVKRHEGFYEILPCSIFPQGAKLTWGIGHLVELKEPHEYKEEWKRWDLSLLPILPDKFNYKVSKNTAKQFKIVRDLLKQADHVIVATDPDREGELIGDLIISQAGASHKPRKRLWINSLEVQEVRRGFQNLKDGKLFLPYAEEAQARQISDWLVGMNFSRLYTLLLQQKFKESFPDINGINMKKLQFSVGRVQTPALKLIYDRQQAIKNFKSEPFYEIEATFNTTVGEYKGKIKEKFNSEQEVQDLMKKHHIGLGQSIPGNIKTVDVAVKQQKAPKLHSLSSLQSLVNRKYKYSPSKVLEVVQSLYDSPLKLVTYPRTDTQYITENEFTYIKERVTQYQQVINQPFTPATLEPNKNFVNGKFVQEHYAIVPTRNIPNQETLNSLSTEQKNIYFEIIKSTLGMFHRIYQYEETTIITELNQLDFFTKGKIEKDLGWKELYRQDPESEEEKTDEDSGILPPVKQGMNCKGLVSTKKGMTQPPRRYTEGQLINVMKNCSDPELEEEEKNILKEIEGLGTEATRASIIENLKSRNYIEVKKNIVSITPKGIILCQAVEGTLLSKPEMTAKWELFLKQIGEGKKSKDTFIQNTILFVRKLIDEATKDVKQLDVQQQVKEINSVDFIAQCPSCKKGGIVDRKTFYGCTEFKNGCKQTFQKEILGKKITKAQIKNLCEKGKTGIIKGFKGKKEFDAHLVLKNEKIEFEFRRVVVENN